MALHCYITHNTSHPSHHRPLWHYTADTLHIIPFTPQTIMARRCKAIRDYVAKQPDELTFKEGEIIFVPFKSNGDMWQGVLNGKVSECGWGWVCVFVCVCVVCVCACVCNVIATSAVNACPYTLCDESWVLMWCVRQMLWIRQLRRIMQ